MNLLFEEQYIKIEKINKKDILKENPNLKMSFFPNLSNVIEEIGLIKMFNEKKILCDYSNYYHVNYLINREKGINNIKNLSINYNFTLDVVLKAIDYMDRFFLSQKSNDVIEISSICLLLSLKFNESCLIKLKKFISHLQKYITNIMKIEQEILITLNYDLDSFSLMDIIHIFFIKNIKLFQYFQRYLDFNILELGYCLILISLSHHFIKIKNKKLGKKFNFYHKKLSEIKNMKIIQCTFILNIIISSRFKKL